MTLTPTPSNSAERQYTITIPTGQMRLDILA
jgi:hypothetical protein